MASSMTDMGELLVPQQPLTEVLRNLILLERHAFLPSDEPLRTSAWEAKEYKA